MSALQQQRSRGRMVRLLAIVGGVAVSLMVLLGLMAGPANAEGDSGTIDTGPGSVSVYTEPGAVQKTTTEPPCEGNACQKIDWCDKVGAEPSETAPVIAIDSTKGGPPSCVKKPHMTYGCCVPDKHGTAKVAVDVHNPNDHKFKVRVWTGNTTQVRWVNGGATETFRFYNLPNGKYTVHAAVWAGGNVWCKFGHRVIKVLCATPAPTTPVTTKPTTPPTTPSSSPTVSAPPTTESPDAPASPTTDAPPPPEEELPVTGTPVGAIASTGVAVVVLGVLALWAYRRFWRRPTFSA